MPTKGGSGVNHGARVSRAQRRCILRRAGRELDRTARRFAVGPQDREGVWSAEDYRRIRAAVMDASGRAAVCVLYQLASDQAVRLAQDVDTLTPEGRRRIAFAYAVARAPSSARFPRVKMGFALGLFSRVLADPNNPAMRAARSFQPSRRTLCDDLNWLEARRVLARWQVRPEHADASELRGASGYATNRYAAPIVRSVGAVYQLAQALGDVPPPEPVGHEWTPHDAAALSELRQRLCGAELAPMSHGPPH